MDHQELLKRLISIAEDLYRQSEGFAERPEDSQLWYNHGYADGMVQAMAALGHSEQLSDLLRCMDKTKAAAKRQAMLPWGKAYRHGSEVGYKETQRAFQSAS